MRLRPPARSETGYLRHSLAYSLLVEQGVIAAPRKFLPGNVDRVFRIDVRIVGQSEVVQSAGRRGDAYHVSAVLMKALQVADAAAAASSELGRPVVLTVRFQDRDK